MVCSSRPKLQANIGLVTKHFRIYKIVLSCDILRQLFHSIVVHLDEHKYLHILWRFSESDALVEWDYKRVIFDATHSLFLSLRVVSQFFYYHGSNFSNAAKALAQCRFAGDILSSVDTVEEVETVKTELIEILRLGGFKLGKCAYSEPDDSYVDFLMCLRLPVLLRFWFNVVLEQRPLQM